MRFTPWVNNLPTFTLPSCCLWVRFKARTLLTVVEQQSEYKFYSVLVSSTLCKDSKMNLCGVSFKNSHRIWIIMTTISSICYECNNFFCHAVATNSYVISNVIISSHYKFLCHAYIRISSKDDFQLQAINCVF